MTILRDSLMDRRNGFGKDVVGGAGATVETLVTNLNDDGLGSFREACRVSGPKWIRFDGLEGRLRLQTEVQVPACTTLDGRNSGFYFENKGLVCQGEVILAYLTFDHAQLDANDDAVQFSETQGPWWAHHLTLKDGTDGLLDCTLATGDMPGTIDWCSFGPHPGRHAFLNYPSGKGLLLGAQSDSANPDRIRVTLHHNHFRDMVQRIPAFFNSRGHAYNNLIERWGQANGLGSSAQEAWQGAELVSEHNIFRPFKAPDANGLPARHWTSDYGARVDVTNRDLEAIKVVGAQGLRATGNTLHGGATEPANFGSAFDPEAFYSYALEAANDDLEMSIRAWAGSA